MNHSAQHAGAAAASQAGITVPDYELVRRIGGGAYCEVWLARSVLGQFRAVKIIYRSRFEEARPFEREFEGIQRFEPISRSHPSQPAILHVGKHDPASCFYYVMELADPAPQRKAETRAPSQDGNQESESRNHSGLRNPSSEARDEARDSGSSGFGLSAQSGFQDAVLYRPHTLRHDLDTHGRLPIGDCVRIAFSLTTALAHLHRHGLVHRDIKPSNVIFINGVPKLGDIGLVTEVGDTQSIVGTEGYIPPEGPGTPQADILSLGKVLYEMSTGLDRRRFAELPEDLHDWPDRSPMVEFNEILLRACAKDGACRYQSAEELRVDLERLQREAA